MCDDTRELFETGRSRRFAGVVQVATRKLTPTGLRRGVCVISPRPQETGWKLCAGTAPGQYSTRINEQFRVCFVWTTDGPKDVEIVDYH
jgi:proteic killer suppression protein